MQISTKNLIASNALWDALISLTDSRIATGEVANGYAPYSVVHLDNDEDQRVVITGNNTSLMITRNEPVPGSVVFSVVENGYFGELIHETLSFDGMDEVASDEYLAEIISFVDTFRKGTATDFRTELARLETRNAELDEVKAEFQKLLSSVKNNPLELRLFYRTDSDLDDVEQLLASTSLPAGIYSYTPLDGGLEATHVVFVSKNSRNTLVAFLHEGLPAISSANDELGKLIKELKLVTGQVVKALQDETSIVYQLFDKPQTVAGNEHTLDALRFAIDPMLLPLLGGSPNRAMMFGMGAASLMSEVLAAVREDTNVDGSPSTASRPGTRPGCLCGNCKR